MHEYNIRAFGKDDTNVMLTRREYYKKPIQGLPPYHSTTLFLQHDELDELIEVLQKYANERGNKRVQSAD